MTDYLDEDIELTEQRRVERHVRFCPRCRRVLSNLRVTIDRLAHLDAPAPADRAGDGEIAERVLGAWRDRGG